MSSRQILAAGILLAALGATGAAVLIVGSRSFWGKRLERGDPVPGLPTLALSGEPMKAGSPEKERYVLAFFSVECGSCRRALPALDALVVSYGGEVSAFAVSSSDEAETKRFQSDRKLAMPIIIDSDRRLTSRFLVRRYPTLVFVNAGTIWRVQAGEMHQDALAEMLTSWVGSRASSPEHTIEQSRVRSTVEPASRAAEKGCDGCKIR